MASTFPFDLAVRHPNPWDARSAPRQARANPALVDPNELGALHGTPEVLQWWQRPRLRIVLAASLTFVTVMVAIAVLAHG